MKTTSFVLTAGFALFAMFFGAGNLVFPLQLGCQVEFQDWSAVAGFLVTAVAVPLFGFLSIMLYQGNYRSFFSVFGKWGALLVAVILLAVMGPFGGIPRCAALSYAACASLVPVLSPFLFCLFFCALIFLFAFRENTIISLLGKWLTPLLLLALVVQICVGLFGDSTQLEGADFVQNPFVKGLSEGYYTLDLIAALFFSSFMFPYMKRFFDKSRNISFSKLAFQVACIAGCLLSLVYVGFFSVAVNHAAALQNCPKELLLVQVSKHLLGDFASIVGAILVTLACLTTSIALAAIVSDFVQNDLLGNRLSYEVVLVIILGISLSVAVHEFTGIEAFLGPIVQWLYPCLIVLCLYNCVRALLFKNKFEIL